MNAIILAAGMGTRLRPLTNDIPKCLVPVNGTPMVERQIQFLHEARIEDITLVSGYKAERLNYLKDKYKVKIVFNERYDTCNNIWSLVKVLDIFHDSYVVEGDVFLNKNCFSTKISQSTYFAKYHPEYHREWGLVTDDNGLLKEINVGDGQGCVMSGISYWNGTDCKKIKARIEELIKKDDYTGLFWDNAVLDIYRELPIRVQRYDDLFEIDTEEELRATESLLNS